MDFVKGLGKFAGQAIGAVVGGSTYLVGEITNCHAIKEVGEGVFAATARTGETVGLFASGVLDVVAGTIREDKQQQHQGFKDMGTSVADTATGIARGTVQVVSNGVQVVDGFVSQDGAKVRQGCIGLLKTAAIATLAIGVLDIVDVVDVFDHGDADVSDVLGETVGIDPTDGTEAVTLVENPNMHHVTPHLRELNDGTPIWVDGDGDTSVDTHAGWIQHNPDYRVKT